MVGTYQVPRAFIAAITRSLMWVPCSMLSTPPTTARYMPSSPCAWAATL